MRNGQGPGDQGMHSRTEKTANREKAWQPNPDEEILIVDDNPVNIDVLQQILIRYGYKTRPAMSGEEALEVMAKHTPALILLDVLMPNGMDGLETCRQIKTNKKFRDIPVLFVSAMESTRDKVRGFDAGAVDYITKPFQIQEVLARVQTHLQLRRSRKDLESYGRMVAHDIKSPLNNIYGLCSLILQDHGLDVSLRNDIEAIQRSAMQIRQITESLLLLALLDADQEIQKVELEMLPLVQYCVDTLHAHIQEAGARVEIEGELPTAPAQKIWATQIWMNFLSNAVKYGGDPPVIKVRGRRENDRVRYEVEDQGPGISPDQQNEVFKEATRLHQVRAEGHGIGLAVVRRIVTRLGGVCGVDSTLGEGSTFYFELPTR